MSKFEDYLMEIHGKQCLLPGDYWPDDFVNWTEDISYDDWLEYGDQFAKKLNANLLEALKWFISQEEDVLSNLPSYTEGIIKAKQAIAKAEEK